MSIGVVAISHTSGAGGEIVGGLVSERLGYGYVDEEVVTRAAEKHGIDAELVADAERRKSLLARFLEGLGTGGWVGAAGGAFSFPDPGGAVRSEDFRSLIREAIREIASRGQVVIVSHGASFALVGRDDLLRVLVTAPADVRARRISEARAIGEAEAAALVRRSDEGRADYLERFYGAGAELPTHYDLVVNTEALDYETAADIVAGVIAT